VTSQKIAPDQEFTLEEIKTTTGEQENPYWLEVLTTYTLPLNFT